jgi:hypothetical protein
MNGKLVIHEGGHARLSHPDQSETGPNSVLTRPDIGMAKGSPEIVVTEYRMQRRSKRETRSRIDRIGHNRCLVEVRGRITV